MIFPRVPLHLMEFEALWGLYLQLEVNKMVGGYYYYYAPAQRS
jgi:hypothetical protein